MILPFSWRLVDHFTLLLGRLMAGIFSRVVHADADDAAVVVLSRLDISTFSNELEEIIMKALSTHLGDDPHLR